MPLTTTLTAALLAAAAPGPMAEVLAAHADQAGPGCVAGSMVGDEPPTFAARGLASVEHGVPLGRDTRFDIASNAKQFTAAIVLQLVREGRLDLDAPVSRYLAGLPAAYAPIRVRHLFDQTSGLRDFDSLRMLSRTQDEPTVTSEDVERILRQQRGLNFAPGSQFAYSNSNAFLLARIAEKLDGKPFAALFAERVAKRYGLAATQPKAHYAEVLKDRAAPYAGSGDAVAAAPVNWTVIGGGSVHSTVPDALRWLGALMRDPVLLGEMTRPGRLSDGRRTRYGGGLVLDTGRSPARFFHNGGSAGYRSSFQFYPAARLAVVVMCNSGSLFPNRIAEQIGDRLLNRAPAAAPPSATQAPALAPGLYRSATGDGYRWVEPAPGGVTVKLSPADRGRAYRFLAGGELVEDSQGLRGRIDGNALIIEDNLLSPERFVPATAAAGRAALATGRYGSGEIDTRFAIRRDAQGYYAEIEPFDPFMRASDTIAKRLTRLPDGAFVSDNGWIVRPAGAGRIAVSIGRLVRFPLRRVSD